jgi:hypothetical protein
VLPNHGFGFCYMTDYKRAQGRGRLSGA